MDIFLAEVKADKVSDAFSSGLAKDGAGWGVAIGVVVTGVLIYRAVKSLGLNELSQKLVESFIDMGLSIRDIKKTTSEQDDKLEQILKANESHKSEIIQSLIEIKKEGAEISKRMSNQLDAVIKELTREKL